MSVVIPTLNEALNIVHVLPQLPAGVDQVVLVDGGSTDGTVQAALRVRPDITVVHQTRRGKGNALACGFAAATGDIIVMMDADGSTQPAEVSLFVERLVGSGADFAKGSRFIPGGGSEDITALRRAGNKVLNLVVNTLYHTHYTDLCYGYIAFWRRCLPSFDLDPGDMEMSSSAASSQPVEMLWGDGFEIETLLNIRAAGASFDIVEVPSLECDRMSGRSNLNAFSDGFRVLRTILVEWRDRRTSTAVAEGEIGEILELHSPLLDVDAIGLGATPVWDTAE
ncbi:MAG: glycosyltransferase family 2 protein [Acidimicrobiales bacterium]